MLCLGVLAFERFVFCACDSRFVILFRVFVPFKLECTFVPNCVLCSKTSVLWVVYGVCCALAFDS